MTREAEGEAVSSEYIELKSGGTFSFEFEFGIRAVPDRDLIHFLKRASHDGIAISLKFDIRDNLIGCGVWKLRG